MFLFFYIYFYYGLVFMKIWESILHLLPNHWWLIKLIKKSKFCHNGCKGSCKFGFMAQLIFFIVFFLGYFSKKEVTWKILSSHVSLWVFSAVHKQMHMHLGKKTLYIYTYLYLHIHIYTKTHSLHYKYVQFFLVCSFLFIFLPNSLTLARCNTINF